MSDSARGRGNHRRGGRGRTSRQDAEYLDGRNSGGNVHRNLRGRGAAQGRSYSANQRQGAIKYLSSADIKALAQSSSAEVLACMNDNEAGFLAAYRHDRYCMDPFMMKRLIKLLYLLVKTDDFDRIASRTLARILSADGSYALFIMKLDYLIKGMIDEDRDDIRRENSQYLNYLVEIGKKAITVIPGTVLDTYPLLVIQKTIQELIKQGSNLDTLEQKVSALELSFKFAREERAKPVMKASEDPKSCVPEPSEHFSTVEILPSLSEVHSGDDAIYLRPNLVKGAYSNWDHYLDVQYRLLREDFVRPLRHGIQHFCTPGSEKPSQDVRVYNKVNILSPVCLLAGMGFVIRFDVSKFSRVNWEHSRRLIFGSLLCLSSDNFEHSIMFATVVKRDLSLLKEGHLIVKFEDDHSASGFKVNPGEVFTMVESTAYFEAYRHVLSKLKEVSSFSDEIPFKSYIIGCKLADIPVPSYSLRHRQLRFNLSDVLGVSSQIVLQDETSWPSAKDTSLDQSQLEALKVALTKEVSVIQGPPGTGKTFIGLKIVESFLRNRSVWDRNNEAPILVVCYTNHALDQFLEGIQAMCIGNKTPNIVRIGGRCKSENLSACVLRNKVKEYQCESELPRADRAVLRKLRESRHVMFESRNRIDKMFQCTTSSDSHLIDLRELKEVMHIQHYLQLTEGLQEESGRELEVWLDLRHSEYASSQDQEAEVTYETMPVRGVEDTLDNYIEVDNEARLIEDDRMIEGEEIELFGASETQESSEPHTPNERMSKENGWKTVQISEATRVKMIKKGLENEEMSAEEATFVRDIWTLTLEKKWQLYNYWIKEYAKFGHEQLKDHSERYEQACERYTDCSKEVDVFVLRGCDVIGITTTGASKHHHILKKIHPKIVIFEEAAEIFEAHMVTSLAPSVQQLVLIGDHKQLQPKPNCYDLEIKYKLGVSLFERLVRNKIPYVSLNVQHRMRPEISSLIHPSIYSNLNDHVSVTKYDHVLGVAKDVFVIDHDNLERPNRDGDVTTHVNVFEADFLVGLCRYLLKQGYHPSKITILTMYRGQLLELKRKMRRNDFEGVRVAAVDDFQGEENDIILLSLVRSNPETNIGFLSSPNRTCVSLSRAKKGFYIIGNLSMLRGKDKTLWPEIMSDLEEKQCIGSALPLYCRVHRENKILVAVPEDFRKSPEGGCDQLCRTRLPCGHFCPRICHPNDMSHAKYKCLRDCPKTLPCGHKCKGKCYQCSSSCQPCSTTVRRTMPTCGHEVDMPCSAKLLHFSCPRLCGKVMRCGHNCQNTCSMPCNRKCLVEIEKTLPCGHKVKDLCSHLTSKTKCPEKCETLLECGHPCVGTCGECYAGRLHVRCSQNCGRQLVCGHTCNFPCASTCPPCTKLCSNFCTHSQCPKKCYEVCNLCMEPCQWQCQHFRCTQPCGFPCDRPPCNEPCMKALKCGHQCIGLCGERCPTLCRICNRDDVCDIFFGTEEEEDARFVVLEDCNHFFEVTSLDDWVVATDGEGPGEVKFKTCPKCRTAIRKSLRYSNQVKETLKDIDEIKRKHLVPKDDLVQKVQGLKEKASIADEVEHLEECLQQDNLHPYRVSAMSIQISVLTGILDVMEVSPPKSAMLQSQQLFCDLKSALEGIDDIKSFVMQDFLSVQQVSDVICELRRVSCAARIGDFLSKIDRSKCKLSTEDHHKVTQIARQVCDSGWKCEKLKDDDEKNVFDIIKALSETYHVCALSEREKMAIVEAIGLTKGHWFKCLNGHYYCIGECGGAMQTSKCPECGVVIGGADHTLASGNVHAPEIDGSRHPAWSEGANLANFDPDQLRFP